jgi:hypothetical protein
LLRSSRTGGAVRHTLVVYRNGDEAWYRVLPDSVHSAPKYVNDMAFPWFTTHRHPRRSAGVGVGTQTHRGMRQDVSDRPQPARELRSCSAVRPRMSDGRVQCLTADLIVRVYAPDRAAPSPPRGGDLEEDRGDFGRACAKSLLRPSLPGPLSRSRGDPAARLRAQERGRSGICVLPSLAA